MTLRSRLPKSFGHIPIIVTPDARLAFWRRDIAGIDPTLLRLAEQLVAPGDVVWDIGCNVGIFSLAAASRAGTPGFVLAIDADTWLVNLLRRSCALKSSPRAPIEMLPAAVDRALGVAAFNIASRGRAANFLENAGTSQTGGAREQHRVVAVTLDWLMDYFPHPTVVKIDVEGAELRALSGAHRLLSEARPILICEVSNENAREVSAVFSSHSYRMYDAESWPLGMPNALDRATANIVAIPDGSRPQPGPA